MIFTQELLDPSLQFRSSPDDFCVFGSLGNSLRGLPICLPKFEKVFEKT